MEKEYTIALLIDSDNLPTKYYNIIISELEELGQIRYKRVYGNFNENNPWTKFAMTNGITPVQSFVAVKGKNATDMVMSIDCMDLFYSNTADAFCLATSDSDFSRLAQRLKEGGKYVVIAGKEQAPEALNNSCHKFIMLDKLFEISEQNTPPVIEPTEKVEGKDNKENANVERSVSAPKIKELRRAIGEIIKDKDRTHDGWAYYAEIVSQLEKRYPQFNYKLYGANGKQDFFKTKIGCEIKTEGTAVMIRLVEDNRQKENYNKKKKA